jgi:hypothetical protein
MNQCDFCNSREEHYTEKSSSRWHDQTCKGTKAEESKIKYISLRIVQLAIDMDIDRGDLSRW